MAKDLSKDNSTGWKIALALIVIFGIAIISTLAFFLNEELNE